MPPDLHRYINFVWVALGVVWAAGALTAKRRVYIEPPASRLFHLCVTSAAFALLFSSRLRVGPLGWRFLPESPGIAYAGFAFTLLGAAFVLWARIFLGGNWSSAVTIKQNHTLVRKGPYAVVRHPIYSGATLAMLGTAMAWNEIRCLLGVGLGLAGWWLKSRVEEAFLRKRFGEEYVAYQREVKALIPFVL